jgi:hypothetical protein
MIESSFRLPLFQSLILTGIGCRYTSGVKVKFDDTEISRHLGRAIL